MSAKTRRPYATLMLAAETRDEIADRMRDVLGDHYFTVVTSNSYDENSERFSAAEVYPSQWLTTPVRTDSGTEDLWGIYWGTPRFHYGVHARVKTVTEAHGLDRKRRVRITFEPDRFVIDHYAPAGYRLQWVFAVERHDQREAVSES